MGYFPRNIDRGRCRATLRSALEVARLPGAVEPFVAAPTRPPLKAWRREVYLRFAAGPNDPDSHQQKGIFHASDTLRHPGRLTDAERHALFDCWRWFNENLIVPRLDEPRAIFWFRSGARDCLTRIWEKVALLRESGIPVRMLRCTDPGLIVYRDPFQVAAVPQRRVRWNRRTF